MNITAKELTVVGRGQKLAAATMTTPSANRRCARVSTGGG